MGKERPKSGPAIECNICHKTCSTHQLLIRHQSYHSVERLFQCIYCLQRFKNADDLGKHTRRLKLDGRLEVCCQKCHRHFKDDHILSKHKLVIGCNRIEAEATSVKTSDDLESAYTKSEDNHASHVDNKTSSNVIRDALGKKKTATGNVCQELVETEPQQSTPDVSGTLPNVDENSAKPSGDGSSSCNAHDESSCIHEEKEILKNIKGIQYPNPDHVDKNNTDPVTKSVVAVCRLCNTKFDLPELLKEHYKTGHQNTKFTVCLICGRTLSSVDSLHRHHDSLHEDDKPFKCNFPDCQMRFKVKNSLCLHEKFIHTSNGYTCEICNRRFVQPSNLRKHMNVHSSSYDFKCSMCSKPFRWKEALQRHMVVHRLDQGSKKKGYWESIENDIFPDTTEAMKPEGKATDKHSTYTQLKKNIGEENEKDSSNKLLSKEDTSRNMSNDKRFNISLVDSGNITEIEKGKNEPHSLYITAIYKNGAYNHEQSEILTTSAKDVNYSLQTVPRYTSNANELNAPATGQSIKENNMTKSEDQKSKDSQKDSQTIKQVYNNKPYNSSNVNQNKFSTIANVNIHLKEQHNYASDEASCNPVGNEVDIIPEKRQISSSFENAKTVGETSEVCADSNNSSKLNTSVTCSPTKHQSKGKGSLPSELFHKNGIGENEQTIISVKKTTLPDCFICNLQVSEDIGSTNEATVTPVSSVRNEIDMRNNDQTNEQYVKQQNGNLTTKRSLSCQQIDTCSDKQTMKRSESLNSFGKNRSIIHRSITTSESLNSVGNKLSTIPHIIKTSDNNMKHSKLLKATEEPSTEQEAISQTKGASMETLQERRQLHNDQNRTECKSNKTNKSMSAPDLTVAMTETSSSQDKEMFSECGTNSGFGKFSLLKQMLLVKNDSSISKIVKKCLPSCVSGSLLLSNTILMHPDMDIKGNEKYECCMKHNLPITWLGMASRKRKHNDSTGKNSDVCPSIAKRNETSIANIDTSPGMVNRNDALNWNVKTSHRVVDGNDTLNTNIDIAHEKDNRSYISKANEDVSQKIESRNGASNKNNDIAHRIAIKSTAHRISNVNYTSNRNIDITNHVGNRNITSNKNIDITHTVANKTSDTNVDLSEIATSKQNSGNIDLSEIATSNQSNGNTANGNENKLKQPIMKTGESLQPHLTKVDMFTEQMDSDFDKTLKNKSHSLPAILSTENVRNDLMLAYVSTMRRNNTWSTSADNSDIKQSVFPQSSTINKVHGFVDSYSLHRNSDVAVGMVDSSLSRQTRVTNNNLVNVSDSWKNSTHISGKAGVFYDKFTDRIMPNEYIHTNYRTSARNRSVHVSPSVINQHIQTSKPQLIHDSVFNTCLSSTSSSLPILPSYQHSSNVNKDLIRMNNRHVDVTETREAVGTEQGYTQPLFTLDNSFDCGNDSFLDVEGVDSDFFNN